MYFIVMFCEMQRRVSKEKYMSEEHIELCYRKMSGG